MTTRFAQRLGRNFAIGVGLILLSLFVGMLAYRNFEDLRWVESFGHAAMILGGMGPYAEPKSEGGKLFEGFYALYSGLLLIGVTGLILAPIIHHVMYLYHLPDVGEASKSTKPKTQSSKAKG